MPETIERLFYTPYIQKYEQAVTWVFSSVRMAITYFKFSFLW